MTADIPENSTQPTSAERIAAQLRALIVRGEIAGGAALRQDHIAERFTSSHVPVREAFQRLEAQGLVVTLPRRGVRVTTLSPAAIKEAMEMRAVLEVLALRHSAPNLTAADIDRLEQAQAQCAAATSLADWDTANCAFHEAMVSACGMPRLLDVLQQLQLTNSRYLFAAGLVRGWQPRSDQDHRLIIEALKEKNVERAVQLLGRHIGTMERVGFA